MFCKECGKSINDDSKFCSYCGSKVEPIDKMQSFENFSNEANNPHEVQQKTAGRTDSQTPEKSIKDINLKRTANFNWDLDGFPSDAQRKEKKVSIEWDDVLMSGNQDNDSAKIRRDTKGRKTDSFFFAHQTDDVDKSVQNNDDVDLQSFLFEDKTNNQDLASKADAELVGAGDSVAVNKFYTFNKKNEEFQRLLDKEYEKLKNDDGFQEIEDNEKEFCTSDDSSSDAQKGGQESELNSPIFHKPRSNGDISGEIEDSGVGVLGESNRLKEAEDGEQIPSERSEGGGGIEVKDDGDESDSIISEPEQIELQEGQANSLSEPSEDELKSKRNRRGRADNRSKTKFDFHAIFDDEDAIDSSNSVKQEKIHKKDDESIKSVNTSDSKVEDQVTDDEDKPKSKGMKILSILFYSILIIVILILGIKLVAPDSSLAVNIDRAYETVVDKITGKTPQGAQVEESKTIEDWIADASSANQNISKIESDPEIKVDITNKDFKGIDASKPFSDSIWYTTDDGQDVYYGGDIVKAVVAYYSDLNTSSGGINDTKIDHLKIGEIRTGEFGFFVATSFNDDKEIKNLYNLYIEPEGTVMKVKDSVEIKKAEEAEE